jgi:hypothetical protein
MRSFLIPREPHKGKKIDVTMYVRSATGMVIKIEHNVPTTAGKQIQWVQTVSSNNEFATDCKMLTRVDPFGVGGAVNTVSLPAVPGICKADDLLPFYWTATDLKNGAGPGLSDEPSWPAPATGRIWSQFVTALTEVTGNDVHHLVGVAWGYDRMADGSVRAAALRTPSSHEMSSHLKALRRMYPDFKYT